MATSTYAMDVELSVSSNASVSLRDVGYRYGNAPPILDRLSFDVGRGECLGIVGVSGVGKTTLLRLLSGELSPTRGTIERGALRVALVSQDYTLLPHLTARGNVELVLRRDEAFPRRLLRNRAVRRRAVDLLAKVGMAAHAAIRPSQLSGGQRQRVAIAQAIAQRAQLLLMDEPFGALDVETRDQLQQLLLATMKTGHLAVVLVTHDLEEALYLCDRIMLLRPNVNEGASIEECAVLGTAPRTPELKASDAFLKQLGLLRNRVTKYKSELVDNQIFERGLLSEADLGRMETIATHVTVISRDLFQERSNPIIRPVVEAAWNNGKRYRYVLPDRSSEALEFLRQAAGDPRRSIEIMLLPETDALFLLGEIVLYDMPGGSVAAYTYGGDIGATALFRLPGGVADRLANRFRLA